MPAHDLSALQEVRVKRHRVSKKGLNFFMIHDNKRLEIHDISETGMSFYCSKSSCFTKGSTHQISIEVDDIIFYSGEIEIIWLRNHDGLAGVEFKKAIRVGLLNGIEQVLEVKNHLQSTLKMHESLPAEFTHLIGRMRSFFYHYKKELDEIDAEIVLNSHSNIQSLSHAIELLIQKDFIEELHSFARRLLDIDRTLREDQKILARQFFRSELHSYYMESAFVRRAWDKPQGYAGDFQMMKQIYDDAKVGNSSFSRLMHKWGTDTPSCHSVRYRRDYLKTKIANLAIDQDVVVCSLACGPAEEVGEFMKEVSSEKSSFYTFILIDQDITALTEAKRQLMEIKNTRKLDCILRFVPFSVQQFVKSQIPHEFAELGIDLFYTAGLYDYLTQPVAKSLTNKIYPFLVEKGELIIGNFHPDNPSHTISDYAADWVLVQRTDKDLVDLAMDLDYSSINVHKDELKIDYFLEIIK